MKRILIILSALFALASPALGANSSVPGMGAATSVSGTDGFYCIQSSGTTEAECTAAQMAALVYSLMSSDATASGTGALTLKTVNSNVGSFGSATQCTAVTVNAKGLTTAASAVTCTPAVGSITGLGTGVATALGANIGSAGAPVLFNGAGGTPTSLALANATGCTISGCVSGLGTGVATALGTAIGTAGSFIVNGGALGSPSSAGTIPAFTLGGTIAGGGNQLNNIIIGTSTPLAGAFTTLNASTSLTLAAITGSTQCLNVNTSGVVSGTGAVCGGSGSSGANPTATAGPTAVNGSATTFMRSDGAPAVQLGSASQAGIVEVDGTTITASAGVITAKPQVTSRTVTGATDTILAGDLGNVVYYNSSSAVAITQPAPTGSFASGFFTTLCNINTGVPTVTPGSGTIGGGSTYALPTVGTASAPVCVSYQSNGTNFNLVQDFMVNAALLTAGTIPSARLGFGTNVFTAAANTLSSAGGLTSTIASGTATIPATAIGSGACGSAVTVSAANVATTDIVDVGFAADPTSTTGFLPTAMLTIVPYPTSGNVNFKACNLTSSSITPTSTTINFRVTR